MLTRTRATTSLFAIVLSLSVSLGGASIAQAASDPAEPEAPVVEAEVAELDAEAAGAVPVYRFYSPVYRGHHYTTSLAERDAILSRWANVWTYEGVAYRAFSEQAPGTVPVYRFWSASFNGHFFTTSASERDHVRRTWPATWAYEGVAYYVYPADRSGNGTVSVSRFWNEGSKHHFYTADRSERDAIIARWAGTWAYEQESFRVLPAAASNPTEDARAKILGATNAARQNAGLAPLREMAELNTIAQDCSTRQAAAMRMAHCDGYADRYPGGWTGAAENVAYGYAVDRVVEGWLNSPGHRANILNPAYTHIGIGYGLDGDGRAYYTQNFAAYPSR